MTRIKNKTNNPSPAAPSWLSCVADPMNHCGAHIPDDNTMWSGLCRSYERVLLNPTSSSAGVTTTHNGGMLIMPNPFQYRVDIAESAPGTDSFSCTNTASTAYIRSAAVPNLSALTGTQMAEIRPVGCGISVTYKGTELNRSGIVTIGLVSNSHIAFGSVAGTNPIDPGSVFFGNTVNSSSTITSGLINPMEYRTADGSMTYNWKPNGVPTYQSLSTSGADMATGSVTGVASRVEPCIFRTPPGGAGMQANQYSICVLIQGDTTTAAQAAGNDYLVEVIWHWEVIPQLVNSVAYELSPSPFYPDVLAKSLNALTGVNTGGYKFALSRAASSQLGQFRENVPGSNYARSYASSAVDFLEPTISMVRTQARTQTNNALQKAIGYGVGTASRYLFQRYRPNQRIGNS